MNIDDAKMTAATGPCVRCAECIRKNTPARYSPFRGYCDGCGYAMREHTNGSPTVRAHGTVIAVVDLCETIAKPPHTQPTGKPFAIDAWPNEDEQKEQTRNG